MKRAYHGDWMDALPSRFINEIPEESVEKNEIGLNENDDFEFNQDNSIEFDEEYKLFFALFEYTPSIGVIKQLN